MTKRRPTGENTRKPQDYLKKRGKRRPRYVEQRTNNGPSKKLVWMRLKSVIESEGHGRLKQRRKPRSSKQYARFGRPNESQTKQQTQI
jgi:hypothetical protein